MLEIGKLILILNLNVFLENELDDSEEALKTDQNGKSDNWNVKKVEKLYTFFD